MTAMTLVRGACQLVTTVLHAAAATGLDRPTPCTDFNLRRLIDHFAGTTGALARAGTRQPLDPDDPWGSRTSVADGDSAGVLAANLDALAAGWSTPAAWRGSVATGGGELPATAVGDMALIEVLVHGWDLARSAGALLPVSPELGSEARRLVEETAELGRQLQAYGPPVALDQTATDFEHALAAAGRDPGWTP